MSTIQAGYMAEGKFFATKKEADDYIRKPKVTAALMEFATNQEVAEWLYTNSDDVSDCFETNNIKRVTKKERKTLEAALDAATSAEGTEFLKEHKETILTSFRWPSVKRLNDDEKIALINSNVMNLTENNQELTAWIIENKDKILDAFDAGVEKQKIPESALSGLAAYRERKAAEKAAKIAA
jgi:dsDNA-binding SOS-regulon protein